MNFIAIIGIVDSLRQIKNDNSSTLKVRVEKPMLETNDEDWYELVKINLDKDIFQEEIKFLSKGSIVGIKGRIRCVNQNMQLIGERIQVF